MAVMRVTSLVQRYGSPIPIVTLFLLSGCCPKYVLCVRMESFWAAYMISPPSSNVKRKSIGKSLTRHPYNPVAPITAFSSLSPSRIWYNETGEHSIQSKQKNTSQAAIHFFSCPPPHVHSSQPRRSPPLPGS
ncbi:uncharacterized protein EV422DRAFT_539062 [Fimicolochytrium jonesii]|uniref:uncharacterized protein n=1 Tax=Fimicolochytrium jonesii TaxID=1396493 RepID=UPI0022FEAD51|nr:uncharacterized protein EV422DRAFT_539062 [Fimicolochytrium jonesii]KAI8818212.1 hypothetical protein EV422DRAFT_539062 [Fimicolochytrium jonesii]